MAAKDIPKGIKPYMASYIDAIMQAVYYYGPITNEQVSTLADVDQYTTRRIVSYLRGRGYIASSKPAKDGYKLHYPTPAGVKQVSGAEEGTIIWKVDDPNALLSTANHDWHAAEFARLLVLAGNPDRGVGLVEWSNQYQAMLMDLVAGGATGKKGALRPDAEMLYSFGTGEKNAVRGYVEIDRGTEKPVQLFQKWTRYAGEYASRKLGHRILVVDASGDPKRARILQESILEALAGVQTRMVFLLSTWDRIEEGVLGPIWTRIRVGTNAENQVAPELASLEQVRNATTPYAEYPTAFVGRRHKKAMKLNRGKVQDVGPGREAQNVGLSFDDSAPVLNFDDPAPVPMDIDPIAEIERAAERGPRPDGDDDAPGLTF